jgi:2,3-diaminopropionate biosynthesis protein SbnA
MIRKDYSTVQTSLRLDTDGILSLVGNTPVIESQAVLRGGRLPRLCQARRLQPGRQHQGPASVGDPGGRAPVWTRPVRHRHRRVQLGKHGGGLAQACRYYGLRFICVVGAKTAPQNLKVLRAYWAEIDFVTEPDPISGELLQARINRVQEILAATENAFWPNQYANQNNSGSHYQTTMHELVTALGRQIDVLFVATSTCGTIRGCCEYVRDHGLRTQVVAVDALGSLIFSDRRAKRMIPGLGAGLRPPLCDPSLIDQYVHVDDLGCVVGRRRMMARESVLVGGSSGGVLMAVTKLQHRIPSGGTCAVILPDRGERYLDTLFSDEWVRENFGQVDALWRNDEELSWTAMPS